MNLREHLIAGVGEACLVCERELVGSWTDYHGQIRCHACGTTYQVHGSHLNDKTLAELSLTKEEVAKSYCDCPAGDEKVKSNLPIGPHPGALRAANQRLRAELTATLEDRERLLSVLEDVSQTCGPSCCWNGETRRVLERVEEVLGVRVPGENRVIAAAYLENPISTEERCST